MTEPDSPERATPRIFPPVLVLGLVALAVVLMAMMAGFGSRLGLWHFRTGFTLLEWAAYGAIGVVILSLPAIWLTRPGSGRRGFWIPLLALIVSIPVFVIPWQWRSTAGGVPPIHDITTDLDDPPEFVAVVPLRADAPNPPEYAGPETAAQQREAYPELGPVVLNETLSGAFHRALDVVSEMGWELVDFDPDQGRIEATDRTFWFGFEDDVVIRLTPDGDGTRVDIRSKSRVGRGDAGTNARRIESFLDRLTR